MQRPSRVLGRAESRELLVDGVLDRISNVRVYSGRGLVDQIGGEMQVAQHLSKGRIVTTTTTVGGEHRT